MSRSRIQDFQPDRLKQVLAARRLNQAQLASMIEVSPATISKWGKGTQTPEREALDRLASVVNVTPEWFTQPLAAETSLPLFRSNASAHVAARAMLKARLVWAQDIAIALEEFVSYPELNLPLCHFTDPETITEEDIERAACECRDLWNLGRSTIQDLALAVESAGIILIREETGTAQIEGLSAWSFALERPFIFLSADKSNGYRSRFDLAHELGHIVLHRCVKNKVDRDLHNLMEKQAHTFAGAFLLPAEDFSLDVRVPVTLDNLLLLKRRWGVSVGAMIMRLHALGIIGDDEKGNLFKRRSARWGGKSEPGDDDRPPEQPRLLQRSVELLIKENVMPADAIPRHVGLGASDIEMLTGLPHGYFKKEDNIVRFVRLREAVTSLQKQREQRSAAVVPLFPKSLKG